jgi:hypothetical protein
MDNDWIARSVINTLIMNDVIIDIDIIPYCIWYPRIPSKKTLQELVEKVPKLNILAGRVCAIAHYNDLYDSLSIPADEAIYQEAIDSGNTYIINKLKDVSRKYYMIDHSFFNRYFPDSPKDDGIVHVLSKVKGLYSLDCTGPDPDVKNQTLFDMSVENTQHYSTNPALQEGLGVQENTFVLNQ